MSTLISQLITRLKALQETHGDIEVILEPNLDEIADSCLSSEIAYDAIHNKLQKVCTFVSMAHSSRDPDQSFEDDIDYGFDAYEDPVDCKKVLVLSFEYYKCHDGDPV